MEGAQDESSRPRPASSPLGTSGMAVVATPRVVVARGGDDEQEDGYLGISPEDLRSRSSRYVYPRRQKGVARVDPITGDPVEGVPRRVVGFGLGFEKIFATTSFKLPVSAYTVFVELHVSHSKEVYSRCFNGLHTLLDLKKWVYEKLLVPLSGYDLSYAEPGKAALTDGLRLLTMEESLDTRTLVATQAVQHKVWKGAPGVHSIGDVGVTRLYVRLKCRTCGDLLNSLQSCRKFKTFGDIEALPDLGPDMSRPDTAPTTTTALATGGRARGLKSREVGEGCARQAAGKSAMKPRGACASQVRVPGVDPSIEDLWYRPDPKRHCLFHTRGYEMFEGARAHGSHAELARIYLSSGTEPSKKLTLASNVLNTGLHAAKISY